jgi:hypothetical protein
MLSARKEHVMSETRVASATRRSRRQLSRSVAVAAGAAAVTLAGASAVFAGISSQPSNRGIEFDRYDVTCDASWSCLPQAAETVHHGIIGPSDAEPVGPLVALGSPTDADGRLRTDTNILTYRFRLNAASPIIALHARGGHGYMDDVAPPRTVTDTASNAIQVAGQSGFIATHGNRTDVWVTLSGLNYRFSADTGDSAAVREAVMHLQLVSVK